MVWHRIGNGLGTLTARVTCALVLVAALIAGLTPAASAVSLSLGPGATGNPQVATSLASALYASTTDGNTVKLAEIGEVLGSGDRIAELGVPSMAPDGRVLFGALVERPGQEKTWKIFIADPNAPGFAIARAIPSSAISAGCVPAFRSDPYPIGGANGAIAFAAPEVSGTDALFLYRGGHLTCVARQGTPTNRGRSIAELGFGSIQMGRGDEIVMTAWLSDALAAGPARRPDRQAVLLVSPESGVNEIAVEGEGGFSRSRYGAFGLPAAAAGASRTEIAFEAQTRSGEGLFLYRDGVVRRMIGQGTPTALGKLTYLSMGRPGLAPNGTTSALFASGHVEGLMLINGQRRRVLVRTGRLAPSGARLLYLGDPSLTAPGAVLFGAIDDTRNEALYLIDSDGNIRDLEHPDFERVAFTPAGSGHTIFSGTLYVNWRGDFTYLGGK